MDLAKPRNAIKVDCNFCLSPRISNGINTFLLGINRGTNQGYLLIYVIQCTMATKRKIICKPLHEKYQALIEVESGGKKSDIAAKYGVPLNTLSTWMKNSEKIKNSFKSGDQNLLRKRIKTGKYEEVDSALFKWFSAKSEQAASINGPFLLEKANKFAADLGFTDFRCNMSWITAFKERHGIRFKAIVGEESAVDLAQVAEWHQTIWQNILQRYESKNIYNCDETGLFYKMLPNRTLAFKGKKCTGGKLSKDRITLLFCTNMDGSDKYPLLAIGKSQKPRSFKNQVTLPTDYTANSKAWMTAEIFRDWLKKFDRKMTIQQRKVALVLDNCAAHPKNVVGLKSTELFFLPPNTTSVLQPLDQGIIRNFKYFKYIGHQLTESMLNAWTKAQILNCLC